MLIRVVDYLANLGGGSRFTEEMLHALLELENSLDIEVVSYGRAADRYEAFAAGEDGPNRVRVRRVRPSNAWRARTPGRLWGIKGSARLSQRLGFGTQSYFEVPAGVATGCDLVWFPWGSRHRLLGDAGGRVLVTMHDVIYLQLRDMWRPEEIGDEYFRQEHATVSKWLDSGARVIVTSRATTGALEQLFGAAPERAEVVPILARHTLADMQTRATHVPLHPPAGFIFCPANISPQKNHEVLLAGVARWGFKRPLALTGEGSDLDPRNHRGAKLRRMAETNGFEFGHSLVPLGYVDNATHFQLLHSSWAVVMPTLAEGGGSFPVLEAMLAGVPVVCSDIPVLREQIERTGGEVLWFDPHQPADLAEKLSCLSESYDVYKRRAKAQAATMTVRSWTDVARDYMRVIENGRQVEMNA